MHDGLNCAFPSLSKVYCVLHGSDSADGLAVGENVTFASSWPGLGFTARLTALLDETATRGRGSVDGIGETSSSALRELAGINGRKAEGAGNRDAAEIEAPGDDGT